MENIAKALVAAQMEMTKAVKGSTNPHYRSKYADLGNVMDACLPALNKNGIAVIQPQSHADGEDYVITRFIHTSGETMETSVRLLIVKADMQGMGSAITYARRYGLMELAGIAPEDDDGNAAAQTPAERKPMKVNTTDPDAFVFKGGKFEGKKFEEIPDAELRSYLKWMGDKDATKYAQIIELGEKHLNGNIGV